MLTMRRYCRLLSHWVLAFHWSAWGRKFWPWNWDTVCAWLADVWVFEPYSSRPCDGSASKMEHNESHFHGTQRRPCLNCRSHWTRKVLWSPDFPENFAVDAAAGFSSWVSEGAATSKWGLLCSARVFLCFVLFFERWPGLEIPPDSLWGPPP